LIRPYFSSSKSGTFSEQKNDAPRKGRRYYTQPNAHGTSSAQEETMPSIYIFAKQTPFLSNFLIYFHLAMSKIRQYFIKPANNNLFFANRGLFKVELLFREKYDFGL